MTPAPLSSLSSLRKFFKKTLNTNQGIQKFQQTLELPRRKKKKKKEDEKPP